MMASIISSRSRCSAQPTMTITTLLLMTIAVILFASPSAAHSFPYVPTQLLMPDRPCIDHTVPCAASDLAYIFRQTASDSIEFRALNFSQSVSADDVDLERPAGRTSLPFLLNKSKSTSFGAARTANGSVLVYAGDCQTGSGDIWSFDPEEGGDWTRRGLGDDGDRRRAPYFLGATVAFSSMLAPRMDQPTMYTYGGMCTTPDSGSDAPETWQAEANYTRTMLSLSPTNRSPKTPYTLSVASSSGSRVPIAGFTLTGLTPSITNKSGTVTQQTSYVLLGGHSESAFINMSTVAVWNLPAESWSYVDIQAPDVEIPSTDLTVKSKTTRRSTKNTADNVYSRSGHTATLSEDGNSIIVLGGWVKDVNTPAEPQLAILEMSDAYSGWQWKIPEEQPDFTGLYGHGAAVLPGNMLMVYGGWELSDSTSSRKTKRQAVSGSLRFYNITSGSWETDYKNPLASESTPETENDNAPKENQNHSNSKKLGLGLGLGFGVAVLIAFIIAMVCWCKRRKRHRENRDKAVRALSQDANHYSSGREEMMERDDDPWGTGGVPWYTGADPYAAGERSLGYESLRGNRGNLPGLHIPHKSMPRPSRGGYVPTGPRPGSFPGPIHPIYEDDEEESYHNHRVQDTVHTPTSEVHSDPFQTPVTAGAVPPPAFLIPGGRASATPSPESPRHDPEVQDWVSDVDAAEGLLARMNSRHGQKQGAQNQNQSQGQSQTQGQGRVSPTRRNSNRSVALRDDESRSGSNLSESARSAAESIKAKARQLNPLAPTFLAAGAEHPKPGSSTSSSSYNTARSSFGALQAEGPALLMGDRAPGRYDDDEPGSPSKSKPRRGWLGSLRRVFSGSSTPTSSREDMAQVRRSFDQEPVCGDYEPGLVGLRGELLRRKQGRQDWEDLSAVPGSSSRDAMMSGGAGGLEPGGESDWDIEKAVEQRLVQVMFTVPRERLRVVNGGSGNDSESDRENDIPVKPQSAVLVDPEKESQRSVSAEHHEEEKPAFRRTSFRSRIRDEEERVMLRGGLCQDDDDDDDDDTLDEKLAEKQHLVEEKKHPFREKVKERKTSLDEKSHLLVEEDDDDPFVEKTPLVKEMPQLVREKTPVVEEKKPEPVQMLKRPEEEKVEVEEPKKREQPQPSPPEQPPQPQSQPQPEKPQTPQPPKSAHLQPIHPLLHHHHSPSPSPSSSSYISSPTAFFPLSSFSPSLPLSP
ncbi:hypothetical protein CDV36_016261, partial [Fusarium kuroshium]